MKKLILLLVLSSTLASANAFKEPGGLLDDSEQTRPQMLSFFAGLPYGYFGYYGFPLAVGARYYIPIMHNGFIPPVNDEFGIEFGADFTAYFGSSFVPTLAIPVEVLWRFHFTEKWSAYPKLGAAMSMEFIPSGVFFRLVPIGAVGGSYQISDTISIRAEVGYPWVKIGVGISF